MAPFEAWSRIHPLRRHGYLGLALLLAAGILLVAQPTDPKWWLVRIPGLMALLTTVAAIAAPPSPRTPKLHRTLGWLAVGSLTAHILLGLTLEPQVWEWFSPAVPVELVAGLFGAAALVTTFAVKRSQSLRRGVGQFGSLGIHRIAGLVACAAAAAHVGLIAGMNGLVIAFVTIGVAASLTIGLRHEKHVVAVAVILAVVTIAIASLALGPVATPRLMSLRASPIDHAGFSHSDHGGIVCTACHHNFVDRSGKENCLNCHKRLSTTETMRIDRLFHGFCGDCHRQERRLAHETGPIDDCSGCHQSHQAASVK